MTHKVANPQANQKIPRINPAIKEYMEPDQEIFQMASVEMEEFDNAFEIVTRDEE